MIKDQEILTSKEETEQLATQNQELEDEVRNLREEIRCLKF